MRTEYKIIALSVLVALLGWTVDAVLDSYFHAAPFWQSLFLDPHVHELVLRLTLVASVIALGATMSITFAERKRAEEALRTAAQSRLNQVLAVTPAAIYTCEAGGRYGATFISGNVKLQVGYEPQEFVRAPEFWADHIHPEDAPRIFQALPNLFKKGHHRHEYRFLHKDGTYRWMLDEMRLVCDAEGNPLEIIGYWADITERKLAEEELERHRHHLKELVEERTAELKAANEQLQQEIADRERAEEALKENEARFRHWVDQAADESYLVDFDGTIVDVNQTACDKLGYTKEELLKLNLADIDIDVIPGKHAEKWKEVLTGERITVSGVRRRKDGTTYPVEVRAGLIGLGGRRLMLGLARDVTERKRAEEALRASQEMLRLVMDSIPQAIFWKDRDSVYLGCNGNFARDAGLDEPAQIVGLTDYDLPWKPEETDFFRAVDRRVMGRGQAEFNIVEPLRTADGRQVWVETNKIPLRDAEGRVVGILGTYADISERKRAEEALKESWERFRSLVETTSDWVWEVDENAVYTYASPKIRDILGYEPEEVLGRTPFDFMPPEEARRVAEVFGPIAASRRPFASLENKNLHRDGHLVVLETSGVPFFDAHGTFRGWRGIDRDITERKRAEEALRIKDNAIASSISAIAIADPEGRLTYVNDSFLRLWGYTGANEVVGKSNLEFWRQPEEAAKVIEALREKGSWVGELVARRKDGSDFDVQLLASMVMDQAGNPICLMASFIDITERKEAEEELKRVARLKDEFLSMASHELKTPITSIKVFAELATRRPDKLEPRFMATLTRQTDQLVRLVNDLLDVSRLQLGRMPMKREQLDLAVLLSDLCERRRPICKGRVLSCSVAGGGLLVDGDPMRLEQVFTNLLDNAAKYSPENSQINVRLGHRDGNAVVEVEDKGVGIPPEHLPHIFERFYKPGPQQAVYPGLGVGLYITKRIIERHGGRIWAESEEGKGSTFCVELPLARESTVEPNANEEPSG
jgi:PAS domain S-box-containing protein